LPVRVIRYKAIEVRQALAVETNDEQIRDGKQSLCDASVLQAFYLLNLTILGANRLRKLGKVTDTTLQGFNLGNCLDCPDAKRNKGSSQDEQEQPRDYQRPLFHGQQYLLSETRA